MVTQTYAEAAILCVQSVPEPLASSPIVSSGPPVLGRQRYNLHPVRVVDVLEIKTPLLSISCPFRVNVSSP